MKDLETDENDVRVTKEGGRDKAGREEEAQDQGEFDEFGEH